MEDKKEEIVPPVVPVLPQPLPKSVYNAFILEIALLQGLVGITGGIFFTGYLCLLGATNREIGWITSIPLLANMAAPFFSFFIDRSQKRKEIYFKGLFPYRMLWFLVAAIPILFFFKFIGSPLLWFSAVFLVMSLFVTHSSIAWTAWMGDLVPWNQRGFYFGKRTYVANFFAMLVVLFAGWYIDKWKPINEHFGFGSLFAIGAIFGLAALIVQKRLPEVPNVTCINDGSSVVDIPKQFYNIMKNKNFMRLVLFNTFWAFIMGLTGVYMNVFLIREVKLEYGFIAAFSVILLAVRLLITGFWGKMMDKYGYKPIMLICGKFIGLIPLLWVFVGWSVWMLVPLYIIAGTFWPGMEIAQFNIMFRLTPKAERASYLAFNTILISVVAFIGPILGGHIIDWIGGFSFKILFLQVGAFQILFFAGAVLRTLPLYFLSKVEEPKETPVEHVEVVVRSSIGVGFMEGFGAMRNYMMIPVQRAGHFIEHIIEKKD